MWINCKFKFRLNYLLAEVFKISLDPSYCLIVISSFLEIHLYSVLILLMQNNLCIFLVKLFIQFF